MSTFFEYESYILLNLVRRRVALLCTQLWYTRTAARYAHPKMSTRKAHVIQRALHPTNAKRGGQAQGVEPRTDTTIPVSPRTVTSDDYTFPRRGSSLKIQWRRVRRQNAPALDMDYSEATGKYLRGRVPQYLKYQARLGHLRSTGPKNPRFEKLYKTENEPSSNTSYNHK